jgi:hypothetical protein
MHAATSSETNVDHRTDPIEDPMADLKRRIATGYEVDSELVAREILRKIRLVKWARQELATASGHTPGRSARGL